MIQSSEEDLSISCAETSKKGKSLKSEKKKDKNHK